jgi:hypothetical protein
MKFDHIAKCKTVRVKSTPDMKKYGIRCQAYLHPENNRIFAGEIGVLTHRVTEGNGWKEAQIVAEFEHGRNLLILNMVDENDYPVPAGGVWRRNPTMYDGDFEALQFKK